MIWGYNGDSDVDDNVIFSSNVFFDSFMENCIAVVTEESIQYKLIHHDRNIH